MFPARLMTIMKQIRHYNTEAAIGIGILSLAFLISFVAAQFLTNSHQIDDSAIGSRFAQGRVMHDLSQADLMKTRCFQRFSMWKQRTA